MPEAAELELTVPPAFSSAEEFRALVSDALRALEEKHQQDVASQGRRFLGPVRVLAQNPFAHPPAGERRFELEPRIAARDKWRRVEGLLRLKSFLRAYRQSWLDRRAGTPNVQFQRAPTSCASCTACNAQEQRRSPRLRTRVRNAAGRARASVADVCVEEPIRASLAEE